MSDAYIPTVCPVHDFHSGTCSADCPDRVGWADLGTLVSNVAGMPELVCAMKDEITASAEMVDVWQTLARKILEARAGTDIGVEDSVTTALVYLDSLVDEVSDKLAKTERSRDSWAALADSAVGLKVERDAALSRAEKAERNLAEARTTNAKLHRRAQGVDARKPDDEETIRRLRAEVRATARHAGYVAGHVYRLQMAANFAQHATSMAVRERDEARAEAERFHEAMIEARRGVGPGSERFAAMEQHRDMVIAELDATWKALGEIGRGRGVTLSERAAKVVSVRDALHAKLARIRDVVLWRYDSMTTACEALADVLRIIDEKEGGQ